MQSSYLRVYPTAFVFCIVLLAANAGMAQTNEDREDQQAPVAALKLEPVFSDDFSNDSRSDYLIDGDVSWEQGKLTLSEEASIERTVDGGAWAKIYLRLEPSKLTKEQPRSELRVWILLEGSTNCYVRLRRELRDGKTWGARTVPVTLTGTQADEGALSRALTNCRYAHLATHGFFAAPEIKNLFDVNLREESLFGSGMGSGRARATVAGRNPLLLSGLVLAGANLGPIKDSLGLPTGEDGILTAEEIVGLNLHNTELVTLSACETGLGDVAAGEGVFGLQRALHQAGARAVVASLWKVSDDATRTLMTEFYTNLWEKKLSKLEALRQAQLTMLNRYELKAGWLRGLGGKSGKVDPTKQAVRRSSSNGRLAPKYWAAFQLSGDWR